MNHLYHLPTGRIRRQLGFSLIELMVGMVIGLLVTLVIGGVLSATEGQRRGTTQGSDAQVNGSLALYSLQRDLAVAGYGFASEPNALGCTLQAKFNGVDVNVFPPQLAPVFITQGGAGASDQVRVLSSSKFIGGNPAALGNEAGYTLPLRIVPPLYTPGDVTGLLPTTQYNVMSTLAVRQGDLMVAVVEPDTPCGLFQVTAAPTAGVVPRADDATRWNAVGHPSQAVKRADSTLTPKFAGSALVNLGRVIDLRYSVDAEQRLVVSELDTASLSRNERHLQSGIVMMKAMYGRDTDGDGVVDRYDYATPINNNGWSQVLSVRVAVLARSAQFEKEEVTHANPLWDVGNATAVAGSVNCGASKCIEMQINGLADWKHYRYKLFDAVVPLRNLRWKAKTVDNS